MIKKRINVTIAIHEIQADIIAGLQSGAIILPKTLREIGELAGKKEASPQKIKHHLGQLVKMGILSVIDGEFYYDNGKN